VTVIHSIHRQVGRNVTGPDDRERPQNAEQAQVCPPGHFLSAELQSDCARFLEDVHTLVRRREQEVARLDARLWA
jgi:hypothetical protein